MEEEEGQMRLARVAFGLLAVLALVGPALAADAPATQGFASLEKDVHEFALPNGLKFIVLERHDAPVFAFRTYANVGAVDEVAGITGIAHMFEHMAFKGTPNIGTTDYKKEKVALDAVDRAYAALMAERYKGRLADSTKIAALKDSFKAAQAEADKYVVSNGFSAILERNGVVGLNAGTGTDQTQYEYELPSNKIELWAMTESDRLINPVLREFYKEREVVIEERRMRTESTASGRLFEGFLQTAFVAAPYGNGLIGHRSDLETFSREQAEAFRKEHYVAKNVTIAVVGDVKTSEIEAFAKKYFSTMSDAPAPPPVMTVEPRQDVERRITMIADEQPLVFLGWHIPDVNDPKWHAYEALSDVIGQGRSSRLYTTLVKEKKLAVQSGMFAGMPGEKYPTLMFSYIVPASGVEPDTALAVFDREVARFLKDAPVTDEELAGFKTRSRARFLRQIQANGGLAEQLVYNQMIRGDWRKLFRQLDEVNAVTKDDVMNAARECLRVDNRTVAILRKSAGSSS
jgi:predicted Zn-dependent peptidase